jgi:hypothetical protein
MEATLMMMTVIAGDGRERRAIVLELRNILPWR